MSLLAVMFEDASCMAESVKYKPHNDETGEEVRKRAWEDVIRNKPLVPSRDDAASVGASSVSLSTEDFIQHVLKNQIDMKKMTRSNASADEKLIQLEDELHKAKAKKAKFEEFNVDNAKGSTDFEELVKWSKTYEDLEMLRVELKEAKAKNAELEKNVEFEKEVVEKSKAFFSDDDATRMMSMLNDTFA
jgi:hypothetical protein